MSTSASAAAPQRGDGKPPALPRVARFFAKPPPTVGPGPAAKAVSEDLSALLTAHRDLAKAELQETAKAKGTGAGLLVAAGVMGWLGLQGLLITLGFLLALVLPGWAAALIVTVLLLAAAAVLALQGRKFLQRGGFDLTKQAVQETIAVVKSRLGSGQAAAAERGGGS